MYTSYKYRYLDVFFSPVSKSVGARWTGGLHEYRILHLSATRLRRFVLAKIRIRFFLSGTEKKVVEIPNIKANIVLFFKSKNIRILVPLNISYLPHFSAGENVDPRILEP